MDKNTITGLLLMGAVILGFMYINQPTAEQLEQQAREQAEQQALEQQQSQADILTVDTISPAERAAFVSTLRAFGIADTTSGSYRINSDGIDIALNSDGSFTGDIDVNGKMVPINDVLAANYADVDPATATAAVRKVKTFFKQLADTKGISRLMMGDSTCVRLENDVLALDLSTKGGCIARAALKEYKTFDSTQVCLMQPEIDSYGFTLVSSSARTTIDTRKFYFTPIQESDTTVVMQLNFGDGATFGIRYTLLPDSYLVKMDVVQQGMEAVIPTTETSMGFVWNQDMPRNEAGRVFEERNSAIYYMYANGDVDNLSENGSDVESVSERVKWIGYKNQFFSAVIVAGENFSTADFKSDMIDKDSPMASGFLKRLSTQASLEYSSAKANPASFTFFFGPNSYPLLSDLEDSIAPGQDLHLTKLIPLGWPIVRWINTLIIIPIFDFLGKYIANYGIIILLLTIFIKIILFPFTYKSYMSQAKMRVLSPEINAINEKYPGQENAMKRQQETMALYSRAGASPFSGCLPMLLQFPILIAMFNFFPSAIELRGESFLWAKDLSAPDAIFSWNTHIPFISSTFGNHISLFCLLMTVVNIIYTKINMQSQPSGNAMPGMKWMMYLMPVMFLFIFNDYASGLSYYYFLSLLITIVQTFVFRRVVNEEKVRATMRENARKPKKKSGFMARLEEAQRKQQAMLREQEKQNAKRRR